MSDEKEQKSETNKTPLLRRIADITYPVLWLLTLASLALNIVVIRSLIQVRGVALQAIDDTLSVLEQFRGESFAYTVIVDDSIPLDFDLPVDAEIPVRINDNLPIDTVVAVPVNLGPFGVNNIDIPIQAMVPVMLDVTVDIDQSFPIQAAIPVYLEVPIELTIDETPLSDTIDDVQSRLLGLRAELAGVGLGAGAE